MQNEDRTIRVQKDNYTAVQTSNNHISIFRGEHMVMHSACPKRKTEAELLAQLERYMKFAQSGSLEDLLKDAFQEREAYDG